MPSTSKVPSISVLPVTYKLPLELILPLAVKWPVKSKSSVNEIPAESPPADWKLSAYIVPLALILPLAVIWPWPSTDKDPVIDNAPVTSVFAAVNSKFVPVDDILINLPAFALVIPGIPLPTEKCALPEIDSSKVKSAWLIPVAFIVAGIITSSLSS